MVNYSEILTIAQTVGIVGTLILTLYFSRRQTRTYSTDLETRILTGLDDKMHNLIEMFIANPENIRIIYDVPENLSNELAFSYYTQFICAHIFHMRERKILKDNEWSGWFQWMKNAFTYGRIGKYWKQMEMQSWFDPAFAGFVEKNLLPLSPEIKKER
ncbi:MAG: hypothetical protein B2I17_08255 [Thermoplasmatales archaeon B_DKE]|nr:MAG: hypothetical protein B2I17_08255 [Thermoplasmatales archaeon B_DKE]